MRALRREPPRLLISAAASVGALGFSLATSTLAAPSAVAAPAPVAHVSLLGVSCTGPSRCSAIGWRQAGSGPQSGAVATLGPGGWSAPRSLSLPSGLAGLTLTSVSCTSAGNCQAVGISDIKAGTGHTAWAVGESNGTWHPESLPFSASQSPVGFAGVSCPAAGSCLAVGSYSEPGGPASISALWQGGKWQVKPMATRARVRYYFVKDVSCTSSTNCEAVGYDDPDSGAAVSLAEHWDGSSWQVQPSADASGGGGTFLNSVSCSVTSCIAVGFDARGKLLAEHLTGGSWQLSTLPQPVGHGGQLDAVSCAAPTRCLAVGYYAGAGAHDLPISEDLVNGSWSLAPVAAKAGAFDTYLQAVSCRSGGPCQAVGAWSTSSPGANPLEMALPLK